MHIMKGIMLHLLYHRRIQITITLVTRKQLLLSKFQLLIARSKIYSIKESIIFGANTTFCFYQAILYSVAIAGELGSDYVF